MELEDKIARAEVIDVSKLSGRSIKFGATVTLEDEETEEEKRSIRSSARTRPISAGPPVGNFAGGPRSDRQEDRR